MIRNRIECKVLLYDVWDNRSFRKLRAYVEQLTDPGIRSRLGLDDSTKTLMEKVSKSRSLAEVYELLDYKYFVDSSGTLAKVPDKRFDLIVSSDVGEHIPRESIPKVIKRTFEALRPGGWAYHQIVLTDHLSIYDKSVHPKEYLRYSKEYYEAKLRSDVQYTNLVQLPEWLKLFKEFGFEIVEMNRVGMSDLSSVNIHPSWKTWSTDDLAATVVQFLMKRPAV